MATVATRGPMLPSSNPLQFSDSSAGGASGGSSKTATAIKRKTPSELRGEQLKRKNVVELVDESLAPELGSMRNANGATYEPTKPNPSRNPRYIDTRVDELFPSRKNSLRLKMLSGKENVKENGTTDQTDNLKNPSVSLKFVAERQPLCPGPKDSLASTGSTKYGRTIQSHSTTSESTFRSVTEISTGGEKLPGFSLDMDKAFQGLATHEPPIVLASSPDSSAGKLNSGAVHFCSELCIPGGKTPLDFTLKTSMRVVTSSPVNWYHRLMNGGMISNSPEQISSTKALYSWVYPLDSLPLAVISALTLSAKGEEFLSKRQLEWEGSFQSLYGMLRKNICNLFYVCTGQFVAMFTNGKVENKSVCSAYLSQSTRSLRSLLKEQDICFTMPLCHSKVEQVTKEDLFELSEIEKYNVGQTKRTVSLSDVDNSPESLLAFSGTNVHGLYDFLLNYRFLLTSLNNMDVPLLYSPVPFENAALKPPEVKCKEVRRFDHTSVSLKEADTTSEANKGSNNSIEIKDAYIPPWIISRVCDAMKSNGGSFEASFVTEPMSIGLNVGLDMVCQKSDQKATTDEGLNDKTCSFGVTNAVVSPHLSRAFMKTLKYSDNSYTGSLSPL